MKGNGTRATSPGRICSGLVLGILLVTLAAQSLFSGIAAGQTPSQGLSKIEMLGSLTGVSSNGYLELLLRRRGIAFTVDDAFLQMLGRAGGQEFLLAKLREMNPVGASAEDPLEPKVLEPLARCAELQYQEASVEAEPFCRAALAADPRNAILNLAASTALSAIKKYDEAAMLARRAIELAPDLPPAHESLGMVLAAKGDVEGSISEYREALKLDPNEIDAIVDEGLALAREKKDLSTVMELFRQALRIQPNSSRAHMALGMRLYETSDFRGAIAEFQQASRLDTRSVRPRLFLGMALFDHKDYDAALSAYREGVQIEPGNARLHAEIGWTLMQKGDLDAAISELREATRLSPDMDMAHGELGEALLRTGDFEAAIPELREATRLAPNSSHAHHFLGEALSRKGDQDAAIHEAREAIRLDPKNPGTHALLATALGLKGDLTSSHEEFSLAKKLDPANLDTYTKMEATLRSTSAPKQSPNLRSQGKGQEKRLPEPERGLVSGQTYKNDSFNFTYVFPQGWIPRSTEELKEFDVNRARALRNKHAKNYPGVNIEVLAEYTLLSVSPASPEHDARNFKPFITLTAEEGNEFQRDTVYGHGEKAIDKYFPYSDLMQTGVLAVAEQYLSYHLERKPTPQTFGGRKFVRADFRIKNKGGDLWETRIVTFANGYFVRLEILTGSREELDRLAETANSFAFSTVEK